MCCYKCFFPFWNYCLLLIIWWQGGDGFFNEILNGFLSSRYKAPYPPAPAGFVHPVGNDHCSSDHDLNETVTETSQHDEDQSHQDQSPLLGSEQYHGSRLPNSSTSCGTISPASYAINLIVMQLIWLLVMVGGYLTLNVSGTREMVLLINLSHSHVIFK